MIFREVLAVFPSTSIFLWWGYTLKNKGASRCHWRTFLSKWFHKEPSASEEPFCFTKACLWLNKVLQIRKKVRKRFYEKFYGIAVKNLLSNFILKSVYVKSFTVVKHVPNLSKVHLFIMSKLCLSSVISKFILFLSKLQSKLHYIKRFFSYQISATNTFNLQWD